MNRSTTATVVIVPGLRDHVADHWQTLLAAQIPGARTVPPLRLHKLSLAARVEALDAVLADIAGPVILVAHSAGVPITVHWSQRATRPIEGALLATPPDFSAPLPAGYPTPKTLCDNGWLPTPRMRLPFASIVAASTNDPLADFDAVAAMAADWGGRLVDAGPVGHLNPAAGFGPWPAAKDFVDELRGAPVAATIG